MCDGMCACPSVVKVADNTMLDPLSLNPNEVRKKEAFLYIWIGINFKKNIKLRG